VYSIGNELGAELSIGELVAATGAVVSPTLVTVGFPAVRLVSRIGKNAPRLRESRCATSVASNPAQALQ